MKSMNEDLFKQKSLQELVAGEGQAELSSSEQERLRDLYAVDKSYLGKDQEHTLAEMTKHGENHTLLVLSRLKNPVIREQWLDLLEANQVWLQNTPERQRRLKKDPVTGLVEQDDNGLPVWEDYFTPRDFTPKTRELLNQEMEDAIARESAVTNIDFDREYTDSYARVDPEDRYNPLKTTAVIGVKEVADKAYLHDTLLNKVVTEAHEKGHTIRTPEDSGYLRERFTRAFDLSKFNPDTYMKSREGLNDEQVLESAKEYLFYFARPVEIIERMSQLKNYFGMKGDELFTKEHLEYARAHYLEDGILDNNMRAFFDAITPETEEAFLELINSSGI